MRIAMWAVTLTVVYFVTVRLVGAIAGAAGKRTRPAGRGSDIFIDMEALRMIESGGNSQAVSPAGARGPYQMCRLAWTDAVQSLDRRRGHPYGFDYDTYAESETIGRIVAWEYVSRVLPRYLTCDKISETDTTGPVPDCLAARLAAYNAGAGAVRKAYAKDPANWQKHLPDETREYISRYHREVTRRAKIAAAAK